MYHCVRSIVRDTLSVPLRLGNKARCKNGAFAAARLAMAHTVPVITAVEQTQRMHYFREGVSLVLAATGSGTKSEEWRQAGRATDVRRAWYLPPVFVRRPDKHPTRLYQNPATRPIAGTGRTGAGRHPFQDFSRPCSCGQHRLWMCV